jgi:hypothetical protein
MSTSIGGGHEVTAVPPLHPDNRHVLDKIRQQLQDLRELGFVEFLGCGRRVCRAERRSASAERGSALLHCFADGNFDDRSAERNYAPRMARFVLGLCMTICQAWDGVAGSIILSLTK